MLKSRKELESILADVKFRDWELRVGEDETAYWIQWRFMAVDTSGARPEAVLQPCRKWRISRYMTKDEVVRTAWLGVETAVRHEAREEFHYKGVAIYNAHIEVDELVKIAGNRDVREEQ